MVTYILSICQNIHIENKEIKKHYPVSFESDAIWFAFNNFEFIREKFKSNEYKIEVLINLDITYYSIQKNIWK